MARGDGLEPGAVNLLGGRRLPVVGVMGSGSDEHAALAEPLGRWLAARGVHLLTGGGRGVMEAVSRAFHGTPDRRGLVLGVLPAGDDGPDPPPGYPNPWVEVAIRTHLPARGDRGADPDSRNHVNVLSSDVIVALPGGEGTASEVNLALRYGRPAVVWNPVGAAGQGPVPSAAHTVTTFDEVAAFVDRALKG